MNTPAPVLQNVGIAAPLNFEGYNHAIQINQQNRMLAQRERFMAQQREANRRQQTGEFVTRQLQDKNALTGTDDDPMLIDQMGKIQANAYDMASQGHNVTDIMGAISPQVNQLNQYRAKAKFVEQERQQSLNKLKTDKGYDIEGLDNESKKAAFYTQDAKTGLYNLKDINTMDPGTDYVSEALKNHPEYANYNGLNEYIKNTKPNEYSSSITTPGAKPGVTAQAMYDVKAPNWMDFDRDDNTGAVKTDKQGVPTGMVPKFAPIKDDNGKVIGRAATQGVFDQMMRDNPSAFDALRGDTMRDMQTAAKANGQDPSTVDFRDPASQLHARALLYQQLQNRTSTYFKKQEDPQKMSPAAVNVQLMQDPNYLKGIEDKSKAEKQGQVDVTGPPDRKPTPSTLPEAVGSVFNGDQQGTPTTYNGKQYEDITSLMPKGTLKYGPSEKQAYSQVLFDPASRSLTTIKPDPTTGKPVPVTFPENQIGQFITQHAEANGFPLNKVKGSFGTIGYQGGKFINAKPTAASETAAANQKMQEQNQTAISTALTNEDYDSLKGTRAPDGVVKNVVNHNILGNVGIGPRFEVTVKQDDGTTKKLPFKSKDEMQQYLTGSPAKSSGSPTSADKPKTVIQNGNTYTLQSDGTYK